MRVLLVMAVVATVGAGCGGGGNKSAVSTTTPVNNTATTNATTTAPTNPGTSTTAASAAGASQLRVVNLFSPAGVSAPPALDVHVTDNGDQVIVAGLAFGKASGYLPVPDHATTVVDTAGKRDAIDTNGSKMSGPDLQSTMVIVADPDKPGVADTIFFTERDPAMDEFALPLAPTGKALLFANAEALPFGSSPGFDLGTATSGCLAKDPAQENVDVSGNQTIRYPLDPGHFDIVAFKGLETPPCANTVIDAVALDAVANHRYLLFIFGIGTDYRSMVLPIA